MPILSVLNQKGGTGKTTTAVVLGDLLAREGHKTLIIDLDSQGNVADLLGLTKANALYEFLVHGAGGAAIQSASREGFERPRLDVILGNHDTIEAEISLSGRTAREKILRIRLEDLGDLYDWIVLDVAPSLSLLQVMAFVACDWYVVPVELSHTAVVGAAAALNSAATLTRLDFRVGRLAGVLPTMWERVTTESREQLEALGQLFKDRLWAPIPIDAKVREAAAYGQTLAEYDPNTRALVGVNLRNGTMAGGYQAALKRVMALGG